MQSLAGIPKQHSARRFGQNRRSSTRFRRLVCCAFLVDNRTIYNCRQNGFNNEIRLVTTTRFRPSTLRNAPHKERYILLRDAFSRNNDDAIYFLIRIKEPSQYAKFCSLLFGTKAHPEKRSPKKHIRLLAKWHRIANQRYHVYCADINAKCYAFDD